MNKNKWLYVSSAMIVGTIFAAAALALIGRFQPDCCTSFLSRWYCFTWRFCVPASITPAMGLLAIFWLRARVSR